MTLKRLRVAGEPSLTDSAHQVQAPAWSIVFIASNDVSWTSFQAQAAVDAGEKLLLFRSERRCEYGVREFVLQGDQGQVTL
jgi:hypothetical protein